MVKRIVVLFIAALLISSAWAQVDLSQLDPRNYDPKADPDPNMFINNWHNATPRTIFGKMAIRDILTALEGDQLHPTRKGAVLMQKTAISYATLEPRAVASGRAKAGEQQAFYVAGGTGTMTSKGKTVAIKEGMGFILTPEFDFTLTGGDKQLQFYVVTGPQPQGSKANPDLVVKNRFDNSVSLGIHWVHNDESIIGQADGLAGYGGLTLVNIEGRTMPQPHSHDEATEECWIQVKGETIVMLGKQIFHDTPGTVYKVPQNGITAHTNVNIGGEPVQMIHMMTTPSSGIPAKSYSALNGAYYDRAKEPDVDMFMGNWQSSIPRLMHGHLVFRDMLTALQGPDELHPTRRGACLTYSDAISYATLEPGATARNKSGELKETQQEFVVQSGNGTISSGEKTVPLQKGMAFVLTPGLNFQLTNTGDSAMAFYVVTEKIPAGFTPNQTLEVVDNRGGAPATKVHWADMDRPIIEQKSGMAQYGGITETQMNAMTISQPYSVGAGVEEIWIATDGDLDVLINKDLRRLPAGAAFRVPPTGSSVHANINDTESAVRLIHMTKAAHQ